MSRETCSQVEVSNSSTVKKSSGTNWSPGDQGMRMWDLHRLEEIPSLARRHSFCDPVSVAMWVTCKDDARETLCFGTGLGYLVFWRQKTKAKMVRKRGNAT